MAGDPPQTEIDARFSLPGSTPTEWAEGQRRIEEAELFWLSTVRPDGRPHVTPVIAVWLDGASYFCTGPDERKAKNLAANPRCILTTGSNELDEGLDVVIEGEVERVSDDGRLSQIAEAYEAKYGSEWHFDVRDGFFHSEGGEALVFEVAPETVFGFRKGEYSQTRWRFEKEEPFR